MCCHVTRSLPTEKTGLETFPAVDPDDGETTILESLGKTKEDDPQDALGLGTDGQSHLGKRKDITRHAQGQHNHARAKRESSEPSFYRSQDALETARLLLRLNFLIHELRTSRPLPAFVRIDPAYKITTEAHHEKCASVLMTCYGKRGS